MSSANCRAGSAPRRFIDQGVRADYFINSEPTDLAALTMHAAAFVFTIELIGKTRHMSKREEAVDAIAAACDLIPRLNAMKFSGARSPEHAGINRVHVGVVHGALGQDLHEWRPPQVADYVRLKGSGRLRPRSEPGRRPGRYGGGAQRSDAALSGARGAADRGGKSADDAGL
jgi:acetylornithine deacetylase